MWAVWLSAGLIAGAAIGFFLGCMMKQSSCNDRAAAYLNLKEKCLLGK